MSLVRNDAAGGAENAGETPSTAARSPSLRKGGESGLSYERAANEVIADACEMVLNNEKMLARLEKDNAKLARSFRDYMRSFLRKIRKAFTGAEATHAEAKAMQGVMRDLAKVWGAGVFGEGEAATQANENAAQESGGKLAIRLTENDLDDYIRSGTDNHARNEKQRAKDRGESPILTTLEAIKEFILDAIHGKYKENTFKGYGKVNDRLANSLKQLSGGIVDIDGFYTELESYRLPHMKDHINEIDPRSIALTEDELTHLPEWIDTYIDLIYVSKRNDGSVKFQLGKQINGHSIIMVAVSKGRHSIHPITAYKIPTERYKAFYKTKAVDRFTTPQSTNNAPSHGDIELPSTADNSISEGKLSVKEESTRFSLQDEESVTDRELLANTLASVAKNPASPTSRKAHDYP